MEKLGTTLNAVLASLEGADDDELSGPSEVCDAHAPNKAQAQHDHDHDHDHDRGRDQGRDHARFLRIAQVRKKWEQALADVFCNQEVERLILAHTNEAGIVTEKNFRGQTYKKLYVYVDDSIVSSELNARRELLKLCFQVKLDEDIELIEILTARGARRKKHPYAIKTDTPRRDTTPSIPLSEEERQKVEQTVAAAEQALKTTSEKTPKKPAETAAHNRELIQSLKKAMVADLEWKKGISKRNTKK